MIRLLIADDEPLVCVGIQSMLRWEDYNIEIAGTARNGRQAAQMIEELRPDIVITDIKMPLKTGLELASECSGKYGRIPLFIFLTSYDEFNFVRQALEYQAVDYLIKLDINPDNLAMSISRAVKILEELRVPINPADRSRLVGFQEKFFFKLFNGLFQDRKDFSRQIDELELEFSGSAFMVIFAEIEAPDNTHTCDEKNQVLYTSSMKIVKEKIEKIFSVNFIVLDTRHFSIVFCFPDPDITSQRDLLDSELRKTINMVYNYFSVHIRMAAGFPVEDLFNLDESYLASQQMFRETSRDRPLVFFGQRTESERRLNYKQQIVANVQEYIRHNLDKKLSLHDMASIFNFSPNYLSQLFAKYSGEGLVEYITAERIKAAKEMLRKGTGPIYEIAEKLGFENAFYFSKVFKKVEGISPREFLRRLEPPSGM
ncbi:MAG: helix-turn-helix domain-containing protein [Treponema sp.]|jgi:two-component system response regulator YesN|nr:helix-turn-helix domain-containing protein [Treponema sp.]